jgi:hypothetical protein
MALPMNVSHEVLLRKQRLQTLQDVRDLAPMGSVEAAKIDKQIDILQGVIRLLEWRNAYPSVTH